jgi:hypothetical protein
MKIAKALQLMNGLRKCDIYADMNFIHAKKNDFFNEQVNGWNWKMC